MNTIEINNTESNVTLSSIGLSNVNCWEQLADIVENEPTVTVVSTMDIFKIHTQHTKPKKAPVSLPKAPRQKSKGRKMTLQEYYDECDLKQKELENTKMDQKIKQAPTLQKIQEQKTEQNTEQKTKRRRNKGWEPVVKPKEEPKLMIPEGWTRNLYQETDTPKDNTTLILLHLPYETDEKNIKQFFEKRTGKVKFVNILKNEDGKCKGIAFVRFVNKEGSDRGLTLSEFTYEGRKVYIKYADQKRK